MIPLEPRPSRPRPRQRGLALVVVLWAAVLLALMAGAVTRTSRSDVAVARNVIEMQQIELAADAALTTALYGIVNTDQLVWRPDGAIYGWMIGDVAVRVQISDEMGRIDLNVAHPRLLQYFFMAVGVEPDLAQRLGDEIADFRDPDGEPSPLGAEDSDYAAAGRPLGAKDAPLSVIDEMSQVLDMTPEIFQRVRRDVTVYTRRGWPNAATASPLVRAATEGRLYEPEDASEDGAQPTAETPVLMRPGEAAEEAYSELLRVQAEARGPGGGAFSREAVVAIDYSRSPPFRFLLWRRGERLLFPDAD